MNEMNEDNTNNDNTVNALVRPDGNSGNELMEPDARDRARVPEALEQELSRALEAMLMAATEPVEPAVLAQLLEQPCGFGVVLAQEGCNAGQCAREHSKVGDEVAENRARKGIVHAGRHDGFQDAARSGELFDHARSHARRSII